MSYMDPYAYCTQVQGMGPRPTDPQQAALWERVYEVCKEAYYKAIAQAQATPQPVKAPMPAPAPSPVVESKPGGQPIDWSDLLHPITIPGHGQAYRDCVAKGGTPMNWGTKSARCSVPGESPPPWVSSRPTGPQTVPGTEKAWPWLAAAGVAAYLFLT